MKTSTKIVFAALAGAAAGIVTGFLLAPASGRDTRKKITKKTDEVLDYLNDLSGKMRGKKKEETITEA